MMTSHGKFKELESAYGFMEWFVNTIVNGKEAPYEAGKAIHVSPEIYGTYVLTLQLRETLFSGLMMMVPICLVMLMSASHNIFSSILAITTVSSITTQVLGSFYVLGWELGLLECISGVIVVGLSMDYSLHYTHVYEEAGRFYNISSRAGRVRHSYLNMGSTIIAGFLSSVTAGIFLAAFAVSPFFQQMGVAIFLTILYSFLMSLFYLPAMLLLIGPQGDDGNVVAWGRGIKKYWETHRKGT